MERRLGRGLGSLLSSSTPAAPDANSGSETIPIQAVEPNPYQPRTHFDEEGLQELRASLERHGLLQPIVVRRKGRGFELVSGERRLRAAREAGWTTIPAIVRTDVSDGELLELALIENLQRRDLDPIERARSFRRMVDELGLTQEQIAERVSLQRSTVTNHLRLLELPDKVQEALGKGLLSMGHGRALLGLPNPKAQVGLLQEIVRRDLSVREVEARVRAARAPKEVPRPAGSRPPWVAPLEARLRDALGTKATLEGQAERGRIVLEYYSRQELERLLEQMAPRKTL